MMELSREQADALADRFDDLAFDIATAFEPACGGPAWATCERLEAVYDSLGVGLEGDDNETHLMRQIVASLHAAMELRAQSLLSRARAPRETSDLHG